MGRRKSLLIGINYIGTENELQGCVDDVMNMRAFLISRGFPTDPQSMVVMTDELQGAYYPDGHNVLAAMDWLVSEPGCSLFLHYSGHGGQVKDPDGDRTSGFDDTIVPVDFQQNGQIDSDKLHRHLVSALPRNSVLHILFDCCHSGSAIELPFVYRTDDEGNINLVDNLKQGMHLLGEASSLIQGGIRFDDITQAKQLYAGATDFFRGLTHQGDSSGPSGLQQQDFEEDWVHEGKSVFMFSGCKDEQTSADAFIGGKHVGAMSWSFLETMRHDRDWNMSYIDVSFMTAYFLVKARANIVKVLASSRQLLQSKYQQIPQLSCGYEFDLQQPMRL